MSNVKKKDSPEKSVSFKKSVMTYLKEVRSEWGKVTWPERRQVFFETLVVLGVVVFFTVLVFVLDKIFQFLLGILDKLF